MTLKATWNFTATQQLEAMHGMDELIRARHGNLEPLHLEMQMIAVTLRRLMGIIESRTLKQEEREFEGDNLNREIMYLPNFLYIAKMIDRWKAVKKLILDIEPEYFLGIEAKLANAMSKEIAAQIDKEIIDALMKGSK